MTAAQLAHALAQRVQEQAGAAGDVAVNAGALVEAVGGPDVARGAVAGAFVMALTYLAGFAALRRSGPAVCAFLLVAAAAGWQALNLGFFAGVGVTWILFAKGAFAAAGFIFLAATLRRAKASAAFAGVLFFAAVAYLAAGVSGFFVTTDFSDIYRSALYGAAALAAGVIGLEAVRGDIGAWLIAPGAAIALAAPFAAGYFGAVGPFAAAALFSLGVMAVALVAITEAADAPRTTALTPVDVDGFAPPAAAAANAAADAEAGRMLVAETALSDILDYAGLSVWDWTPTRARRTERAGDVLGVAAAAPGDLDALRDALDPGDAARFEAEALAGDDGPFSLTARLKSGRAVRLRGARAVDDAGALERFVLLADDVDAAVAPPGLQGRRDAARKGGRRTGDRPARAVDVAGALANDRLYAAFQPIVSLDDERVVGYEALLRAEPGVNGGFDDLSTEEIVLAAEAQGRGADLAALMLAASAEFLAKKRAGAADRNVFAAFNVSFRQMRAEGFVDAVARAVQYFSLPPKTLVVELTETDAVTDEKAARVIFERLRAAGAGLAFDDFGAGFSSLANLHKFAFDFLKIDKSFVDRLDQDDPDAAKIVAALASLGAGMGLTVIAEGLSRRSLATQARLHGCTLGQGFAFGRPETPDGRFAGGPPAPAPQEAAPGPSDPNRGVFKTEKLR
ncbi:MAG: EAL domain-containing protein [Pseudomonadota bacterium]